MRALVPTFVLACALAFSGATTVARADAPSADALRSAGRGLRNASTRNASIGLLCALPSESLDAIRTRIGQIRGERPSSDAGYAALLQFAQAAGAPAASDPRDLMPAIGTFPDGRFTATHAVVAERYCLVRSLERMGTAEALVVAGSLLTFDMRAFRWQARHVVSRAEKRAVPMLIRAASNPNREVDLWADWGLATLGVRDSGDSVQGQSEEALIEVLRAYAGVRHMGGMPVVASFIDDPRLTVRQASRAALGLYAENSIWELRRLYTTRLGEDPGNRSWQVLSRDLFRKLDERREAPLRERADRALAALAAGRAEEASTLAEALLVDAPVASATTRVAPVFLARANALAASGDLARATAALERAFRLGTPTSDAEATALRARLRDAALARRGIVESEERVDDPTFASGTTATLIVRRRFAQLGFLLAFLLLSGSAWLAIARRLATSTRDGAMALATSARDRYRDGGRERIEHAIAAMRERSSASLRDAVASSASVRARAIDAAMGLPEHLGSLRERFERLLAQGMGRSQTMGTEGPTPVPARAPSTRIAESHPAASVTVTAAPVGADRPAAARRTTASPSPSHPAQKNPEARPRVAAQAMPARPEGPSTPPRNRPLPAADDAHARRERPTRRAVADANLFVSSAPRRPRVSNER